MQVVVELRKVVELHAHRARLRMNQASDVVFEQSPLQFLHPPDPRAGEQREERHEAHEVDGHQDRPGTGPPGSAGDGPDCGIDDPLRQVQRKGRQESLADQEQAPDDSPPPRCVSDKPQCTRQVARLGQHAAEVWPGSESTGNHAAAQSDMARAISRIISSAEMPVQQCPWPDP